MIDLEIEDTMNRPFVVDARPVRNELLTPREFMTLTKKDPRRIERAEFIPPSPGKPGFGMFDVRYRLAFYKRAVHG